jgi:hypothetical protein
LFLMIAHVIGSTLTLVEHNSIQEYLSSIPLYTCTLFGLTNLMALLLVVLSAKTHLRQHQTLDQSL